MPIAGLPARIRSLTKAAAISEELVSVSSIIGLLQVRPSRFSIASADAGPQPPDGYCSGRWPLRSQ